VISQTGSPCPQHASSLVKRAGKVGGQACGIFVRFAVCAVVVGVARGCLVDAKVGLRNAVLLEALGEASAVAADVVQGGLQGDERGNAPEADIGRGNGIGGGETGGGG